MNVLTRGVRNAFRNSTRTISVVVILGLITGLALAMLVARQAVETKIESVKASIGNTISISPAGAQGFMGGGEPLTTEQIDQVTALANVSSVSVSVSDRWDTDTTSLESAVEAGTLGNRFGGNAESSTDTDDSSAMAPPQGMGGGDFTPSIQVSGTNDLSTSSAANNGTITITSGDVFDVNSTENVAIIGTGLAEKNGLAVGDTFTAYDAEVTVVGIYDAGTDFANNSVIMPIAALQVLSGQDDEVSSATVTVNSIDNVESVVAAIEAKLGDAADVTSQQDSAADALEPLESIKNISLFSAIAAAIAGAVIILMIMVMTVRERRREIGVLKAIGANNGKVTIQFMIEAVTLTLLGAIVGVLIGVATSGPITNALVSSSENETETTATAGPGGEGFTRDASSFRPSRSGGPGDRSAAVDVDTSDITASIGWDVLAYGLGGALLIAVIGSAAAATIITKVRPAEVMRAE